MGQGGVLSAGGVVQRVVEAGRKQLKIGSAATRVKGGEGPEVLEVWLRG